VNGIGSKRGCGLAALLWVLLATPALAANENREMNAVSRAWDAYAVASSNDNPDAVAYLSQTSLAHFAFLRDSALFASTEQLRRMPLSDRVLVYALRASGDAASLQSLDGTAVARLCTRSGWCGVARVEEGESLAALAHVTLLDANRAVGEFAPPTGTQFMFGPELVREQGQWKVVPESLAADESAQIEQQIKRSGMTENQMLQLLISSVMGEANAPALVTLERPLLDDADARTRLNETWPRYRDTYKSRVQALARKSEQGDTFAQFMFGSMLVSGSFEEAAPTDKPRGWKLLEQASEGGNSTAAWYMFGHMMSDRARFSDAYLRQALTHLQRAADAGNGQAMAALGSFYLEGLGGLPRDCVQAADWQARAEESGVESARNDRVWTLATCPIAAQRNPARALQLADYMVSNRDSLRAAQLDTVAAAYAANRNFTEAARFQQLALDKLASDSDGAADAKGVATTRKRMQARLSGYQGGKDYVLDYSTLMDTVEGSP